MLFTVSLIAIKASSLVSPSANIIAPRDILYADLAYLTIAGSEEATRTSSISFSSRYATRASTELVLEGMNPAITLLSSFVYISSIEPNFVPSLSITSPSSFNINIAVAGEFVRMLLYSSEVFT